MGREDIIRMANDVGIKGPASARQGFKMYANPVRLKRFAALVAAHEREACAKVCDVLAVHPEYASDITKVAAQAIRARGNK